MRFSPLLFALLLACTDDTCPFAPSKEYPAPITELSQARWWECRTSQARNVRTKTTESLLGGYYASDAAQAARMMRTQYIATHVIGYIQCIDPHDPRCKDEAVAPGTGDPLPDPGPGSSGPDTPDRALDY